MGWTEDSSEWLRLASAAGLDPVLDALEADGLDAYVENTGGNVMVVTVFTEDGTLAVLPDETAPGSWVVAYYPDPAWTQGGEHTAVEVGVPLDAVARTVRAMWAVA